MNAIEVSGLKRNYGSFEALKGISFSVPKGSIFGFLGPNGAGKTTTLYILAGLLKAHSGEVSVLGFNPVKQGDLLRSRIGCLLEEPGVYDTLTCVQNLQFHGRAQRMDEKELKTRINESIEFFELSEFKNKKAATLSKGMRQKLALSRAMLANPDILFLDEPTANLDPQSSVHFRDLILKLAKQKGTTVFLNTHRLDEAQKTCDYVTIINQGMVLESGSLEQIQNRETGLRVRIKSPDFAGKDIDTLISNHAKNISVADDTATIQLNKMDSIPTIVSELVAKGIRIYQVNPDKLSLEEIFMGLVEGGNHVE